MKKLKRSKSINKCVLSLLILILFLLITDTYRTKTYGDYELYLCDSVIPNNKSNILQKNCPRRPIVTVEQLGRLGNHMWLYASVWAVAKETGRDPYVPGCIIKVLEEVFDNLLIPSLAQISHCPVTKYATTPSIELWNVSKDDILLPQYAQLPEFVVPRLDEVIMLFKFKKHLLEESQRFLMRYSIWKENTIFVGVHVRRTDYIKVLPVVWNKEVVKPIYFLTIMEYFEVKYSTVMFIVVSDDPDWCKRNLQAKKYNVAVVKNSLAGQDLAILAACNHSIIDYGTFGMWGAMLAGGETYLYNISWGLEITMSHLMTNWHVVN
ncbi:hypothetical protein L9F63_016010 [Diploptera punctata]|uniref:L-Fucosyltransferase n=1 Tax=Diploptera punctata TaxID=6984 RepID=A0AAD8EI34_DIPPU|nr:hypothetical protein L9F63_016010 [Diploptera punctata]